MEPPGSKLASADMGTVEVAYLGTARLFPDCYRSRAFQYVLDALGPLLATRNLHRDDTNRTTEAKLEFTATGDDACVGGSDQVLFASLTTFWA